jgi:TRAP-type C4-dicarboxylate transport system substrate-binding protein
MVKLTTKLFIGFSAAALTVANMLTASTSAQAETINIRIASGHPPTVVYAGLMKNFFEPELKKAIESKTSHKVNFIEGYSGSIVKVFDTFEGVQNGVVDIGGFCYCFEASKLPMHAFQIMLPFGTMDPVQSVGAAADIYNQYPSLAQRFQGFDQTLIAIIGDGGYNLGTNFPWKKLEDLKGHKILGAGLNLNWMKQAGIGIVPVTDGLPGWYQKIKTGVAEGGIMFPSAWGKTFGLWEVGKYYTTIGFGSITWHGLTVNNRFWAKLPADAKPVIQEVAGRFQALTGSANKEGYEKDMAWLKKNITVTELPADVRLGWAKGLAHWPQKHADALESDGFPAKKILNSYLDAAEKQGYKWPVRYVVK